MLNAPAAPLQSVPSLELVESDGEATEESQISNEDLMQALTAFRESVMGKLGIMEKRLEGIEELMGEKMARRRSISSVQSKSSLKPSGSAKKYQAPSDNLAKQALQMDISSLMPTFKTSDTRSAISMGEASWKLGPRKQKEKAKRRVGQEKEDKEPFPGLPVLPSAHQSHSISHVGPLSDVPGLILPAVAMGTSEFMESGSEGLRTTERERTDTVQSDVKASECSTPTGEDRGGSKGTPTKSRRASVQLNRAVSRANITEVFKVRENELTADLSKGRLSLTDKKKVVSVVSIEEGAPRGPACDKISRENSDSDGSEDEALEMVEEVETDMVELESFWLKLSPLNIFITCYVSKALGLVPLFDPVTDDPVTWRSCLKRMVSRSVILLLLYFLVECVWTLSLCHMSDDSEEVCSSTWPPLAVDMVLLMGAIFVLMSWGGLLQYTDTTKLVAQSAAELEFYTTQKGLSGAWKTWSCKDALWTLLFWFILVPARYIPSAWNCVKEGHDFAEWQDVPRFFSHGLLTGILVVASFWQVRTSHAMLLILNSWIASLLGGETSCLEAKQQWRRVSGLFRKTSRTFEHCFAALASLIVALALSALYDLRQGIGMEVVCGAAAIVFILPGVLWTHASTTTACNRLPSLVTLCEVEDEDEDAEYMSLAMYLSLSECGFFVWDTCVTVAFVQKFLYFALALAGTIGFQTGALKLS